MNKASGEKYVFETDSVDGDNLTRTQFHGVSVLCYQYNVSPWLADHRLDWQPYLFDAQYTSRDKHTTHGLPLFEARSVSCTTVHQLRARRSLVNKDITASSETWHPKTHYVLSQISPRRNLPQFSSQISVLSSCVIHCKNIDRKSYLMEEVGWKENK